MASKLRMRVLNNFVNLISLITILFDLVKCEIFLIFISFSDIKDDVSICKYLQTVSSRTTISVAHVSPPVLICQYTFNKRHFVIMACTCFKPIGICFKPNGFCVKSTVCMSILMQLLCCILTCRLQCSFSLSRAAITPSVIIGTVILLVHLLQTLSQQQQTTPSG